MHTGCRRSRRLFVSSTNSLDSGDSDGLSRWRRGALRGRLGGVGELSRAVVDGDLVSAVVPHFQLRGKRLFPRLRERNRNEVLP